jgi:hypothetical protein
MMSRRAAQLALVALTAFLAQASATAAAEDCTLVPRTACYGAELVEADLSSTQVGVHPYQAGAHPNLHLEIAIKQDPESTPNVFGLRDAYATTRDISIETPPGMIGDPNVIGPTQQCSVQELVGKVECPNASQIGISTIAVYQPDIFIELREPLYMMEAPGGDAVARIGMVAGQFPLFIDLHVRSEDDYGLSAEVTDAPTAARPIRLRNTLWGVPADPSHDTERCLPGDVPFGCTVSKERPPGGPPLPFLTAPTRCGVTLQVALNASSWLESGFDPQKEVIGPFPTIVGCNQLPFGPGLTVQPTNRHTSSPTGLDVTVRLPASGVKVLEPAHMRDIRVTLPEGLATNPAIGEGLGVCSAAQVHFKERVASECPDAAKVASTEFDIPALPRRMKGAIYLREPEPGNPFRIWIVADDLGAHVKLPGQLNLDPLTGQIESIVLDAPQAPLREVRLLFKSGFRAPLVNPPTCGAHFTSYEFTPWSGNPPTRGATQMAIDEGCEVGGFSPRLSAGATDPTAGKHSPFLFTLSRSDGEQNPASFEIALPRGLAATFTGIPRCLGADAVSGTCPPGSRIGKVTAAVGAGPAPLWVPQAGPGMRPTAVYLSGPYKGAPLSIVAVVPRQAGPFDFGDEVVRSAIHIDPVTAQATARTDALPQIIEGIPIRYRTLHVELDRPGFALNPTSCARKQTEAVVRSAEGAIARPTSSFAATDCDRLAFKPRLRIQLLGGTGRGAHPRLRAVLSTPPGGANIAGTSVTLPRSQFIENAHFKTICTRVQFAADACPAGSIYGFAKAKTRLFDETLSGPVYLRSSSNQLPDLVLALRGPDSFPVEVEAVGRIDSAGGRLRTTFENIPDAPLTQVVLQMQGGEKGLIVNSRNLCTAPNRILARFSAHNGKRATLRPKVKVSCGGKTRKPAKRR